MHIVLQLDVCVTVFRAGVLFFVSDFILYLRLWNYTNLNLNTSISTQAYNIQHDTKQMLRKC